MTGASPGWEAVERRCLEGVERDLRALEGSGPPLSETGYRRGRIAAWRGILALEAEEDAEAARAGAEY